MNPLLPEPANNLGRNVSHGVTPGAKPGVKTDSEDSTRFQDTLKANTPGRSKITASNSSDGDNRGQVGASTTDNAAAQAPLKSHVSETGGHLQPATTPLEPEIETVSDSVPPDAQLIVLETARISVEAPIKDSEGAPAFTVVSNSGEVAAPTPSLRQAESPAEIALPLTQINLTIKDAMDRLNTDVETTLEATPGVLPAAIPDTGLAREIPLDTMAGTSASSAGVRLANADTAVVMAKPVLNTAQVELEKPFAAHATELNLTGGGVDKKNPMAKPAGVATNTGIPFSLQPVNSNLDRLFANRMPTLDADTTLEITSVPKGSSSSTGSAYAAVSAVAAMQINEAVADHRVHMPVNIKFGQPEWAGMVAERTAMMASQKISFAELQLDPPELGPLQVKVTVQHDQASINFVSASPAVRDSLEQTAVRLREMLDQQGLDLVDVNVADHSKGQQRDSGDRQANSRNVLNAEDDIPSADSAVNLVTVVASGIDHYV